MPHALLLKPFISVPASIGLSKQDARTNLYDVNLKNYRRPEVVCLGMLPPRKFMQKGKKLEVFKDAADEADQKNWRKLIQEIVDTGTAVPVLRSRMGSNEFLPKGLVLGTLVRLKQLKKWNLISEILEWLRTQQWWNFNKMDFVMLITAYGKQGDFVKAEKTLSYMNKEGFPPNVVSYTALMEAYGIGGQYNKAEAVFRRMQTSGPEPSAITYQIILKIFVEANKFKEAEEIFQSLMNDKKSPLKPDQKMFHMMIYMHKKARSYEKAYKLFCLMKERGVHRSTVTFNSLMSFANHYKEVSRIYDQMQRAGLRPDVVSYALLIHAYGKARREDEALAVFEEMLDAGVRPTRKTYNILLDAFAISGMVEHARTVFMCMRRDRFTPDLCSYVTLLSAYVNAPDMEGAEKFFKRLRQDGIEPNIVTYGTLIKGYAKMNDLEKMMQKYEEMVTSGIKANQIIFTTMMDAYGRNKDFGSGVFWFKEMEVHGCPPDQKAKKVLLSLAKTNEEREEADQLTGNKSNYQSIRFPCGGSIDEDEDEDEDDNEFSDKIEEATLSESCEERQELVANLA